MTKYARFVFPIFREICHEFMIKKKMNNQVGFHERRSYKRRPTLLGKSTASYFWEKQSSLEVRKEANNQAILKKEKKVQPPYRCGST